MEFNNIKNILNYSIAGILIGIGMGGFVDGIVLHQILQWHNMLSNWIPPHDMHNMKINMVADGIFHAGVWFVTFIGIMKLHQDCLKKTIPSKKQFLGQLIFGWGFFNLVEGIIDHQILAIHYVKQTENYTVYNLSFLAIGGILFLVYGYYLMLDKKNI